MVAEEFEAAFHRPLSEVDPEVARLINGDLRRQQEQLVLIPSENYASPAVLAAFGSVLQNKYAEGYPGRRYYNGCEFMDAIESLAIERAKQLFGAEHANVQPHSGSQANVATFLALLEPGDRIVAMRLDHGGHLSHGLATNIAGRLYDVAFYGVDRETGRIDLDEVADLVRRHRPKLIIVGGSAYPRTIDFAPWREIADSVGAYLLADIAHIAGMVAAGIHPSPVPYADVVTMTTHKTLRGPRGAIILCRQELAERIDRAVFPGLQGGPFMNAIAARAVCFREAMQPEFKAYQRQIVANAKALAQALMERGLKLVSGGTDNHLMLVDLTDRKISGRLAADRLEEAGIIVNRNTIPYDPRSPFVTSGLRPGTPAVTTRGMRESEMVQIADWIVQAIQKKTGEEGRRRIREEVRRLCEKFPIYPELDYLR
ncbi:MAG: serine hydroxymethyltransferase [Candidatus Poribacteria bacterium]|nr:MAG: serine hydroxymethyltransferase [Candidatus Poribacteria bacterium]